jgi:DNA-binding PadR family transcriptional regulator
LDSKNIKYKINHLLNALAPLSQRKIDMGEVIVLSFLQAQWMSGLDIRVNDVLDEVAALSSASLNRKLKNLKKKNVLTYKALKTDERVKIIEPGPKYYDYLELLDSLVKMHEKLN